MQKRARPTLGGGQGYAMLFESRREEGKKREKAIGGKGMGDGRVDC